MKVFMSWSGQRSKATAELLKIWTKCVIQATQPWISTSIDRGAVWSSTINDELKEASFGIVCLTHENKDKPWILFESGALAKGLAESRVCTFLIDLDPQDVGTPLSQFNHTMPNRDGMWNLAVTLNNSTNPRLEQDILLQVFETHWPWFEMRFKEVLDMNQPGAKPEARTEESILSEILDSVRGLDRRMRGIEDNNSGGLNRLASAWNDVPESFMAKYGRATTKLGFVELKLLALNLAKQGIQHEKIETILMDHVGPGRAKEIMATIFSNSGAILPDDLASMKPE